MSSAELTVPAPKRYRGAFWRLYRSDLRLLLTRRRNLVLIGILALVPIGIGVAVKVKQPGGGDGPQFLDRIAGNGLFLIFTAITVSLPLFLPLVLGIVAGDSIAGEAGQGTLRYLLTVPVARARLLASKTLAVATAILAAVLVVAVAGLVIGAALFGLHSLVLLSGDTVGLGSGLARTAGVVAYVTVALWGLGAVGMFVSTLTENAIAAMATTVGFAVLSEVLNAIPQLSSIHPLLISNHWLGFGDLLRSYTDTGQLVRWELVPVAYIAIFLSLAWARITTKDITS